MKMILRNSPKNEIIPWRELKKGEIGIVQSLLCDGNLNVVMKTNEGGLVFFVDGSLATACYTDAVKVRRLYPGEELVISN